MAAALTHEVSFNPHWGVLGMIWVGAVRVSKFGSRFKIICIPNDTSF